MAKSVKSLQQHLISLGWSAQNLSADGRSARMVGLGRGDPYYEPFSRLRRLIDSSKLRVRNVLQSGTRLKFLGSLRHEVHGVGGGLVSRLVNFVDAKTGSSYANESIFLGYIQPVGSPPLDLFPFDTWL